MNRNVISRFCLCTEFLFSSLRHVYTPVHYMTIEGDWWLELYVMLSRATRLDDLLLLRAPPSSWLLQGPPPDLKKNLQAFASRTAGCRARAEKLARELGFSNFLH